MGVRGSSRGSYAAAVAALGRSPLAAIQRDERLFLCANFTSNLGNGIQIIASAYLVLIKTNSMLSAGILFVLAGLPQAILASASGALADKGHQKQLCILSDLVRALCVAAIPVSLAFNKFAVPTLYAATFVVALFDAIFTPVGSSWIQQVINREDYARFSTFFEVSTQSAALISSAVGGFCVQWLSAGYVFGFNALTFVISAALLYLMTPANVIPSTVSSGSSGVSPARPAVPGRQTGWRPLIPPVVLFAQNRIVSTVMNTLLVVLVIKTFQKGMGILGVVDALAGFGFTAGALTFALLRRRFSAVSILVAGSVLSGLFIFPQPLLGVPGLAVAFLLSAIFYGVSRPAVRLILMDSIENQYSGRVFGAANAIGFAGGALGTIIISGVVNRFSIAAGYFAVASYFLAVTITGALPLLRQASVAADSM